ncbi:MAG: hypothetical protein JW955_24355 [Sedimentisphaerales bacterium]|nr:hypothetical protein [Sedimentisphaerales bacterium]
MNVRRYRALNVVATGLLVLIVTSIVLFWARWGCESARYEMLPEQAREIRIEMPGFLRPKAAGAEPNAIPFTFAASMRPGETLAEGLGLRQYWNAHNLEKRDSRVVVWSREDMGLRLYYDRSLGVMVYHFSVPVPQASGRYVSKKVVHYAGPKGISDRPEDKLGRFHDPIVRLIGGDLERPVLYDRGLHRFFVIDWRGRTVQEGKPVAAGADRPVDFDWPRKQPACLRLALDTQEPHVTFGKEPDRTIVLDAAGNLRMLDLQTLEYAGLAGALPSPATLFPSYRRATPDDLFAYEVHPVFSSRGDVYAGCAVAALSRDAAAMRVEVFDANGTSIAARESLLPPDGVGVSGLGERRGSRSTVDALYFELPNAPVLTAAKFILESLHPPALLWLSYFTASSFEATSGYRSLFLLPNSFAAMSARDVGLWWLPRFVRALLFLLPGVVLGGLLSRLVSRDAQRLGMSTRARRLWMAATVVFALPAYVTFEITRTRVARVTCQNCGRDRRVDMERCHRCGSPWVVPDLIPPAWRVIGQPEEQPGNDPAPHSEERIPGKSEV